MRRFTLPSLVCLLAIAAHRGAGDGTGSAAVPVATRWSAIGEPSDAGYRVSLARGGLDVGLDFHRRLAAVRVVDAGVDSAAPPGAMLPALSFGLHSGTPVPTSNLVDRTLGSGAAAPSVSRVGIEYKPAQSRVILNQGFGFHLSGDDKLTMRLRKGSLSIFLKRRF